MLNTVRAYILDNALVPQGAGVLAGLSGGMDSMALVDMLSRLRDELSFTLYCAHFDHRIRSDSYKDAEFAEAQAALRGAEFFPGSGDVPAYAAERGLSLETAARELRHSFFKKIMAENNIGLLALGHHMNDRAETLLMRLLRGSGPDGLAAMPPKAGHIIRPLLCLGRRDIELYCRENNIPWREDDTNTDTAYTRNALRIDTMEHLSGYNPSVVQSLCRTAELLSADREYFDGEVSALCRRAQATDGGFEMQDEDFLYVHKALRMRCIRRLFGELGLTHDLYAAHIADVEMLFIKQPAGKEIILPQGFSARRHPMGVELVRPDYAPQAIAETPLDLNGETYVPGAGTFLCETVANPGGAVKAHSRNVEYLNSLLITGAVVRARREGDRFHPLGAPGEKKLKEYFIDKKISRWRRDFVPLVACGNDIIWAVGHVINEKYKVDEACASVIKITYKSNDGEMYEQY